MTYSIENIKSEISISTSVNSFGTSMYMKTLKTIIIVLTISASIICPIACTFHNCKIEAETVQANKDNGILTHGFINAEDCK